MTSKTNYVKYYVDEKGMKQGEYIGYYSNGNIQNKCNYKN
jgi:antitoxin component YwqK of YwqJK toxin-antitoxin module